MSQQQPNVLEAINNLFGGLEISQKKGVYSFEESAKLYGSMLIVKQYFTQVTEAQKKAVAQQQALQQKKAQLAKLPTIQENDPTVETI